MMKKSLSNIKKSKTLEELKKAKKEFKETSVTLIMGGFGLVAALAWNEAIKSLVETFFQKNDELIGKFTPLEVRYL